MNKEYMIEGILSALGKVAKSIGSVSKNVALHTAGATLSTAGSISRAVDKNPLPPYISKSSSRWRWYIKPLIGPDKRKNLQFRKRAAKN